MAELDRESLSTLTVAALKDELSARNLPTSGLKDDLVARLREAVEREHCCGDISDNVAEINEQSKKAEEEKQLVAQEKESVLEGKLMQLLSFMTDMKTDMKEGQEESGKRQEEMETNIVKVVNVKVDAIEEKIGILGKKNEEFEEKFEEMKGKVEKKFEEIEGKFEKLKQEIKVQDGTSQEFGLAAANQFQNTQQMPVVNKSCMKLQPYDGQTSWQVYRTQFAIVAEANCWDPLTKARQLAAALRAEAADILRTIPENEQFNFDTLSSALELRFGDKCLKDYSRLQLKTRQQRPNETLQELATDIEKLSHLAFSDCPAEVRETLAVQYFVDGVRDAEIQKALRMAETKDLKSALVYAIKFEAAQQASRRDRHFIRGAEVKPDEDSLLRVMTQLLEEFREMKQKSGEGASQFKRNNLRCWKCGSENHLQRSCKARPEQRVENAPKSMQEN